MADRQTNQLSNGSKILVCERITQSIPEHKMVLLNSTEYIRERLAKHPVANTQAS